MLRPLRVQLVQAFPDVSILTVEAENFMNYLVSALSGPVIPTTSSLTNIVSGVMVIVESWSCRTICAAGVKPLASDLSTKS
jgi:hypothetical protein